eukprot:166109_1
MELFKSHSVQKLRAILSTSVLSHNLIDDIISLIIDYYNNIIFLQDRFDEGCCDPKLHIDNETQTLSTVQSTFAICCGKTVIQNGMAAHWQFVIKKLSSRFAVGDNMGIGLIHKNFSCLNEGLIDDDKLIYWWSMSNAQAEEFGKGRVNVPYFEVGSHLHIQINLLSNNKGKKLIFMKNNDIIYESKHEDKWPTDPQFRMFVCTDWNPQVVQLIKAQIIYDT